MEQIQPADKLPFKLPAKDLIGQWRQSVVTSSTGYMLLYRPCWLESVLLIYRRRIFYINQIQLMTHLLYFNYKAPEKLDVFFYFIKCIII